MKLYIPIIACMLLACNLFAAPSPEDNDTETEQQAPQPAQPADNRKPQTRAPAKSFTPSEKVGADSAVSFPVDI